MTKATAKAAMTVDPPAIPMINPREDAKSGLKSLFVFNSQF